MAPKFDKLDAPAGLNKLNGYLTTRSYIDGFSMSDADLETFKAMPAAPATTYVHLWRWYKHIAAKTGTMIVAGAAAPAAAAPAKGEKKSKADKKADKKAAKKAPAPKADDDDMDDMFGDDSDDEMSAEELKKAKEMKIHAAKEAQKKAKKVDRTQCVFEIKPWDAEQSLDDLAAKIKKTEFKGLSWGEAHKLVPVAFGIKKLIVSCIVVDDEVALDDVTDLIEGFEDEVQSVDLATMNRL